MNMQPGSILLAAALALAAAIAHTAEAPADGLYLAASGPPAAEFRTEDGETIHLGEKLDLKLQDKWLKFRGMELMQLDPQVFGNWEATFNLQLTAGYEEMNRRHVLVVGGTVYRQSGASGSGQETASMHFGIWNEQRAGEVARHFDIPIQYPAHPGHRLRVWFTPDKPVFARGEPVTVTLHIENLGNEPVSFTTHARGTDAKRRNRTPQFVFAA